MTQQTQLYLCARCGIAHHRRQVGGLQNFGAVEIQDHVADLYPGLFGGTVGRYRTDQRADTAVEAEGLSELAIDILDRHAQLPTTDMAGLTQLPGCEIGRASCRGRVCQYV